ncbi:MAG: MurT ligase domain-containing protein [Coriobacteriales bacterium]|jgi:UDP-N-acetylmuramyl tripeptide synthase|nr:MurT ligase domain-containing protein [Coriobacteriales bacterium]
MMQRLRFFCALWIAKLLTRALKAVGRPATQLPGKTALRICPDFLGRIGRPKTLIAVTGTNGKTTVCNILADALEYLGYRVANNSFGSNLNAGIASTLLADATLSGKARAQFALLEVDERSSRLIYPFITPDYLVCTNLFRDSVGRNAHTEYIAYVINSALPPVTRLILNADDLVSSMLGTPSNPRSYFGIDRLNSDTPTADSLSRDIIVCAECGSLLEYEYVRYHHLGKAHCPNCTFGSHDSDYLVTDIDDAGQILTLQTPEGNLPFRLIAHSIFNVYNQLAALAVLLELGIEHERLQAAFGAVKLAESRFSEEKIGDVSLVMQLAKGQNAIACSRAFDYIAGAPGRKAVILNLDDYFDARGGSENITWLYDCDYEYLTDPSIAQLVLGGVRSYDHYLRLLIAGVSPERMERTRDEQDTADLVDLEGIDAIYICYDVYTVPMANAVRDRLRARLQGRRQEGAGTSTEAAANAGTKPGVERDARAGRGDAP